MDGVVTTYRFPMIEVTNNETIKVDYFIESNKTWNIHNCRISPKYTLDKIVSIPFR